ncbi:MAG: FHA domain-containing serine/threonine-protein kinase [Planctomycetota bacterium]
MLQNKKGLRVQLVIANGELAGTIVPVETGQSITVGRSEMNDVVIADSKMSRVHAKFENDGTTCKVQDLNSSNGTFVNQKKITAHVLSPGEEVLVGETIFTFEIESGEQSAEAQTATETGMPALMKAAAKMAPVAGAPTVQGESALLTGHKFCAKCGRMIPRREFQGGKAVELEGKCWCAECADPYLGRVIGNYRLLEKIGQGSMGLVFRAEHNTMARPAAVKILFEYLTLNPTTVKRFLREAKSGGGLSHPNLVGIYDAGEDNGTYYIAMEFVEGKTLADILKERGRLPVSEAIDVCLQIAQALQYAFEKKVIHRDIKPANILVSEAGAAKLIDMGTAKSLQDSGLSEITRTGMGIGTINFMSPEQIFDAKNCDHRADVYSLGATLYFSVTGELPFKAKTPREFLAKVNSEKIESPKKLNPQVPDELCKVLEKMMAKDAVDRYQTPGHLILDLLRVQGK